MGTQLPDPGKPDVATVAVWVERERAWIAQHGRLDRACDLLNDLAWDSRTGYLSYEHEDGSPWTMATGYAIVQGLVELLLTAPLPGEQGADTDA